MPEKETTFSVTGGQTLQDIGSPSMDVANSTPRLAVANPTPVPTNLPPIGQNTLENTSVITSEPAQQQVSRDTQQLDQALSNLGEFDRQAEFSRIEAELSKAEEEAKKVEEGIKRLIAERETEGAEDDEETGEVQDEPDIQLPDVDTQQIEADLATTKKEIDSLRGRIDKRTEALINSIESEYDGLIAEQREQNKRFEGGIRVEGIRSGRTRYASAIQSGILQNVVNTGIGKVRSLENQKMKLVIQAEQARDENDIKLLSESMKNYRTAIKEQREAAQETFENLLALAEEARAESKADLDRQKAQRIEAEADAENIAASVMSLLGDDPQENSLLIQAIAEERNLDANLIISKVGELEREERNELTSTQKDYAFAVSQGYTGSFLQFKRDFSGRSEGSGRKFTLSDVQNLNLPFSFIGVPQEQIINTLQDDQAPDWFKDGLEAQEGLSLVDSVVNQEWRDFKAELTLQKEDNDLATQIAAGIQKLKEAQEDTK